MDGVIVMLAMAHICRNRTHVWPCCCLSSDHVSGEQAVHKVSSLIRA